MAPVNTVKVANPKNPDDFLIVNETDVLAGGYVRWEDHLAAEAKRAAAKAEEESPEPDEAEAKPKGRGKR